MVQFSGGGWAGKEVSVSKSKFWESNFIFENYITRSARDTHTHTHTHTRTRAAYYVLIHGPGSVVCIVIAYGPGAHPAFCTMGTGSFLGVKRSRGMMLTPHPLVVPWSWNNRSIPLLPLWAIQLVQSLSACTMVQFTLFCADQTILKK